MIARENQDVIRFHLLGKAGKCRGPGVIARLTAPGGEALTVCIVIFQLVCRLSPGGTAACRREKFETVETL